MTPDRRRRDQYGYAAAHGLTEEDVRRIVRAEARALLASVDVRNAYGPRSIPRRTVDSIPVQAALPASAVEGDEIRVERADGSVQPYLYRDGAWQPSGGLDAALLQPRTALRQSFFHYTASPYGLPHGNGTYAGGGGLWSVFSAAPVEGFTREYRAVIQWYYQPNPATTDSNAGWRLYADTASVSGSVHAAALAATVLDKYTIAPGTAEERVTATAWAAKSAWDDLHDEQVNLQALSDWATAVGTITTRDFRIDVRYVPA